METKPAVDVEPYLQSLYNLLKDLPDVSRFPLPKSMYEKYNIPPPKLMSIREALKMHYENQLAYLNSLEPIPLEIRPPAKGGVRPILDVETPELKVYHGKTLNDIDLSGNIIENETSKGEESK